MMTPEIQRHRCTTIITRRQKIREELPAIERAIEKVEREIEELNQVISRSREELRRETNPSRKKEIGQEVYKLEAKLGTREGALNRLQQRKWRLEDELSGLQSDWEQNRCDEVDRLLA